MATNEQRKKKTGKTVLPSSSSSSLTVSLSPHTAAIDSNFSILSVVSLATTAESARVSIIVGKKKRQEEEGKKDGH